MALADSIDIPKAPIHTALTQCIYYSKHVKAVWLKMTEKLILISSDDLSQASLLTEALTKLHNTGDPIDLTGEGLIKTSKNFNVIDQLDAFWPQLQEKIYPWLNILKLDHQIIQQAPLLPGLEDCLKALYLINELEENPNHTMICILPPPAQAQRFLLGIINAPDIIGQLYIPLIARISELKEKLSSFEALLNLKIPRNISEPLTKNLRKKITKLAGMLQCNNSCECYLAIQNNTFMNERISGFYFCGIQVSKIWINSHIPVEEIDILKQKLAPSNILATSWSNDFMECAREWLEVKPQKEANILSSIDANGIHMISFLMPLINKSTLQVQRSGSSLLVRSGYLKRSYALADNLLGLESCGARLEDRRLEVRFR